MAIILDGKKTSETMMEELQVRVEELKAKEVTPTLALILTGGDKYSRRYVKMKVKRAERIGIETHLHHLKETTTKETVELVERLCGDPKIHGVMIQLPVAKGLNEGTIVKTINPEKDVDGISPLTLGKILLGEASFLPAGVDAIFELFRRYGLD
ncbi:MAG: tetrahydrofolate dehydrogenase/cyclohydrolase catalytic domain-containing protein, partial [Candidatus Bathyarchaeota archaeon]|nr:tetrahydrofolate dehydrogenase/cyclohydrolase catalytic domain-containing protein [Candidatus Bathyarchaeota archaeon]